MIISNIVGGLGNQMFQYAFAYILSKKLKQELKLDLSAFKNKKYINPEGFLLDKVFEISSLNPKTLDFIKVLGVYAPILILKNRHKIEKICTNFIREEELFTFDTRFNFFNKENSYLYGWWQAYKYFEDHEEEIRDLFSFKKSYLDQKTLEIEEKLISQESVSMHIRLGDYLNNPEINKMYGTISLDYYMNAVEKIKNIFPDSKFYIFTDSPENIESIDFFSQFNLIDSSSIGSWNDMFLMSRCKHNIIANSSFSWWAAFLNNNDDRMVIAPKNWFVDGTKTPDLIYPNWLKL